MALVSLNAVRKSYGSRTVLDGLDFAIEPRARVGVIGANGSGKSTMLRLIAGLEEPDAGTSVRRRGLVVSFLPQHPLGDERTALETVRAARPDLDELDRELHRVAEELASPELAADLDRMARVLQRQEELVQRWEAAGGPSIEGRARATLLDLGLEEADLTLPTSALSGGQRKLIALAACLAQDPDVLLLDEPEAHLDAVGRALLERLLASFDGAAVAVSHDRYLLDETVSQIAELDRGRIRIWPGNYSAYTLARELELRAATAAVRDAAEGDRAAGGGDPPLQGLGAPSRRRAPHQAGAQQAAADRPDGEGGAAGARTAEDRAATAPARARRPARLRAPPRRRPVRRGRRAGRRRADGRARRARRLRRRERRRQERAPEDRRRRARADRGRGLGRAVDPASATSPRTRRRSTRTRARSTPCAWPTAARRARRWRC